MGKLRQDIPVQEEDDAGGALSCGQMPGAPTGRSALSLCPCGQQGPVAARRPGRGGGGQNPCACRLSHVPHLCLSLRIHGALSNRVRHTRGARSPDQTSASVRGLAHQEMWGRGPKLFQITGSSRGAQIDQGAGGPRTLSREERSSPPLCGFGWVLLSRAPALGALTREGSEIMNARAGRKTSEGLVPTHTGLDVSAGWVS